MKFLPVVIGVLALGVGCSHKAYVCTASDQCVDNATQGTCQPEGFCSFPDPACTSGERFEPGAGGGFAGTCVEPGLPDAGLCGSVGMSCCTGEQAEPCVTNAFCDAGTCKQCVTQVSLGTDYSCFLKSNGTVWCTGANETAQLGNGGTSLIPTAIPSQVRDSTAGAPITDAIALAGGEQYSCVIRADKTAWCWGDNDHGGGDGSLGDGTDADRSLAVRVIRASDGAPLTDVAEIRGSYCHTCARDSQGATWCWGCNGNGELGDGTIAGKLAAVPVLTSLAGPQLTGALELTVGGDHNCVRKAGDEVWCWGGSSNGQVGNNTTTNALFPVLVLTASSVSAGRFHTCATKPDQTTWCWGHNRHRRLGTLNAVRDPSPGTPIRELQPAQVVVDPMGTPFMGGQTAANENAAMSCVVTTDHRAFCWGDNLYGQTGTGTGSSVPAPVLGADGKPLTGIDHISAGYTRACAFMQDGRVLCWGRNHVGQLGDGTFENRGLPTPLKLTCP